MQTNGMSRFHLASHPASSLLQDAATMATVSAQRNFRRNLQAYKRSIQTYQHIDQPKPHDCTCLHSSDKSYIRSGTFFTTFTKYKSTHLPSCPVFSHGDFLYHVEKEFTCRIRLLKYCVRVGFLYAKEAGQKTICPTLRYHATVSKDSPAFKPIFEVLDLLEPSRNRRGVMQHVHRDESTFKAIPEQLYAAVVQSFRSNLARPSDLLEDGTGILHVSICLPYILPLNNFVRYCAM